MKNYNDTDSRSPPLSGGVVTRAPTGAGNDTAQPSLTSGFGAVIEKEQDLQSATEGSFGQVSGHNSADLDRLLHHQHLRLGANIALLEQRYEALPRPGQFVNWRDHVRPPSKSRISKGDEAERLSELVEQHSRLRAEIDALIGCAPDGQRGEIILTEVSRSHEEMAWMLTALLQDESARRRANESSRVQENWDNEGGPVRNAPPSS